LILTHACAELQAKAVQEQHRLEKEMSSSVEERKTTKKCGRILDYGEDLGFFFFYLDLLISWDFTTIFMVIEWDL